VERYVGPGLPCLLIIRERFANYGAEMVEAEEERINARKEAVKTKQKEAAPEKESKDSKDSKASSKA
jgi:hypothetical protein